MESETIDQAIGEHISNGRGNPRVIILHPDTYKQFMLELTNQMHGVDFTLIKNPKYRNIKVYRSEDINENEVEVY